MALQKVCEELKQKLSSAEAERDNQHLTMSAEIDDLNRTKNNLEERLIELIRLTNGVTFISCSPLSSSDISLNGAILKSHWEERFIRSLCVDGVFMVLCFLCQGQRCFVAEVRCSGV